MKIVRFAVDDEVKYGILQGEYIQGIEDKPYLYLRPTDQYYRSSEVKLLSPCTPSKIVALGVNYHSHVEKVNAKLPNSPMIFLRQSTVVIGHDENITYPPKPTRVDYKGELAVVIKKPVWRVLEKDALDYVLGYTCFNNVTNQANSFDTFAAAGPWIETELDPGNAVVETYLNGELVQRGNTSDLIYSVRELINFSSHVLSMTSGDIITTGTPSGAGPMYPGDIVEIKIDGVGTLRNYVV